MRCEPDRLYEDHSMQSIERSPSARDAKDNIWCDAFEKRSIEVILYVAGPDGGCDHGGKRKGDSSGIADIRSF